MVTARALQLFVCDDFCFCFSWHKVYTTRGNYLFATIWLECCKCLVFNDAIKTVTRVSLRGWLPCHDKLSQRRKHKQTCRVVHAGFMDVRFFNCKCYFPTAYIDTKRYWIKRHVVFHIHPVRHPKHSCLLTRNVINGMSSYLSSRLVRNCHYN